MEYCDCGSLNCRVCSKSLPSPEAKAFWDEQAQASMRRDFENFCRQPPNFYNLTPSTEEGKTYWALSTERAFAIWKAAVLKTMEDA